MILHIVTIAIVLHILGFIWYSKALFGHAWARVTGKAMEDTDGKQKGMALTIILNFILSIVTVAILAWALAGEHNVHTAMKLSFVIWFGFAMPMHAGAALWSGKPRHIAQEMFLVSTGYQLLAFLVAGALLAAW